MSYFVLFVFGLAIGSFVNAGVYRSRNGGSWFFDRSKCPKCGHVLFWFELIPLLSFVIQRGRCRACKQKISWQYPIVELISGLLFIFIYYQFSLLRQGFGGQAIFNFQLWYPLFVFSALLFIFIFDLKYYIIPNRVLYPLIAAVLLYNLFSFNFSENAGYFLAAALAAGFFLALYLVSRGAWIGFGDVKFGVFMGLFVGLPNILAALFLSYLIGAAIGSILLLSGNKSLKSQVPFGPFLITGTFIAYFYGKEIINWYLNLT